MENLKTLGIVLAILTLILLCFLFFGIHSTTKFQEYDIMKGNYNEDSYYDIFMSIYGPRAYKYVSKNMTHKAGNYFYKDGNDLYIGFINSVDHIFGSSKQPIDTNMQIIVNNKVYSSMKKCMYADGQRQLIKCT